LEPNGRGGVQPVPLLLFVYSKLLDNGVYQSISGLTVSYQQIYFLTQHLPSFPPKSPQLFLQSSVEDPDLHVFGPPESGFFSQRYGSGSGYGSFLFPYMCLAD
jgi:hypothetical protein